MKLESFIDRFLSTPVYMVRYHHAWLAKMCIKNTQTERAKP